MPLPQNNEHDWLPFNNYPHFEFALWNFRQVQTSKNKVNKLLRILTAQKALETSYPEANNMYINSDNLLKTINSIPYGKMPWTYFYLEYTGPLLKPQCGSGGPMLSICTTPSMSLCKLLIVLTSCIHEIITNTRNTWTLTVLGLPT